MRPTNEIYNGEFRLWIEPARKIGEHKGHNYQWRYERTGLVVLEGWSAGSERDTIEAAREHIADAIKI